MTIEAGVLRAENPNPRRRGERGDQFSYRYSFDGDALKDAALGTWPKPSLTDVCINLIKIEANIDRAAQNGNCASLRLTSNLN